MNCPLLRPETEDMLMTEPVIFASRILLQTDLETSQDPVKLVLKVLFHSSSVMSNEDLIVPAIQ